MLKSILDAVDAMNEKRRYCKECLDNVNESTDLVIKDWWQTEYNKVREECRADLLRLKRELYVNYELVKDDSCYDGYKIEPHEM